MFIHFSRVWLFATLWTVAHQAPLSMGFSRWEYWTGLPCPPPGDLLDPRVEPTSAFISYIAGIFFIHRATWEGLLINYAPIKQKLYLKNKVSPWTPLLSLGSSLVCLCGQSCMKNPVDGITVTACTSPHCQLHEDWLVCYGIPGM